MRLTDQSGWGWIIVFVEYKGIVTTIIKNTAYVDFVKVGDKVFGHNFTVLTDARSFIKKHPELVL